MNLGVFERQTGHEQVVYCHDAETGLKSIIGIYSTALGPALGGTRFYPYTSEGDALDDVVRLSRAMAYKNALAGLNLGGGKAVVIGDPTQDKTTPLLQAYGRAVSSLGGRYITACDVGTDERDMDVIADECKHVVGCSPERGGSGDPSAATAYGVYRGMLACAEHLWGTPALQGRRVGIAGVGKVGHRIAHTLAADGAEVVVTDVRQQPVETLKRSLPQVEVIDDIDSLVKADLDVYAPCALGGTLNDRTIAQLQARIVCGAANNQLAHDGIDRELFDRDVIYAPDYVVNAGGVIHVADEIGGFNEARVHRRVASIYDTTLEILRASVAERRPPGQAANNLAKRRLSGVPGSR